MTPGTHSPRSQKQERGSALLIVFLFAAIVAITLYMEMPVAVFEAQRQKEQLLVDRGKEYAHAVKLYYRKFGTYPPGVEALENTNRMRFLRHKFKDPFTGKDDWRLLHAGPGGILIDSKVKPLTGAGQNAANVSSASASSTTSSSFGASSTSGFGNSSSFGSSSTSSFGNSSSFGSNTASATPPEVTVAALPQRPPAIPANGAGEVSATDPSQNPTASLLPGQAPEDGTNPNQPPNNANPGVANEPAGQTGQNAAPGQNAATQSGGQPGVISPGMPVPGQPGTGTLATGTDPTGAIRNLLTNPNPATGPGTVQTGATAGGTTSSFGTTGTTGVIRGPGLAGVASKAGGHSIKRINEQDDYSLWEFYYDPTKDSAKQLAGAQAALQGNQNQAQNANQNQNQTNGITSGFGTTGFGQNPSSSSPQASPQPTPGSTMTTSSGPPQD